MSFDRFDPSAFHERWKPSDDKLSQLSQLSRTSISKSQFSKGETNPGGDSNFYTAGSESCERCESIPNERDLAATEKVIADCARAGVALRVDERGQVIVYGSVPLALWIRILRCGGLLAMVLAPEGASYDPMATSEGRA
jgi:hypothetical protein